MIESETMSDDGWRPWSKKLVRRVASAVQIELCKCFAACFLSKDIEPEIVLFGLSFARFAQAHIRESNAPARCPISALLSAFI